MKRKNDVGRGGREDGEVGVGWGGGREDGELGVGWGGGLEDGVEGK